MGLAYAPLTLIVLREAPPHEQGSASSALSLTDALGTALGTGLTGAIVAESFRQTGDPAAGLAVGFAMAIGVGVLGLALSGRLRTARRSAPNVSAPTAGRPGGRSRLTAVAGRSGHPPAVDFGAAHPPPIARQNP